MHLCREEEYLRIMDFLLQLKSEIELIKPDLNIGHKNTYYKLINFIEDEIKKNEQSIKELKEPFLLFVVGSGNYGKSTVINTLLKENVVQTTDLPNTWKLDLFIKSKKEKIEITYDDNSQSTKSLREGTKAIKLEEEKYKISKKKIGKLLQNYKKTKTKDIEALKNYKLTLENQYLYKSNISQIKYYVDKSNILDDFIIVDTPGLNQTLLKNTLDRVYKYYEKADGIIWILDAQNVVSKESNDLIAEIGKLDSIGHGNKNIIGVINKMDIISDNNIENIDKVKKRAKQIYHNKFDDIIFISAKEALEGIINDNNKLINKSNINELYEAIDKRFKNVSQEKQIKSKHKNINIMKANILNELHNYKRLLYNDISKFNEVSFELKDKMDNFYLLVDTFLKNIKSKNYITEKEISMLEDEIIKFQDICNIMLEDMYQQVFYKANFSKEELIPKIELKIYLIKSKYLILESTTHLKNPNNGIIDNIISRLSNRSLNEDLNNSLIIENSQRKLTKLSNEINGKVDEKVKLIELTIDNIKNKSFREKHIDYSKIKEHLNYLNKIETIIKNLR
ncbi:MAG: dynamin family protein [Peptostreptococcaceae bacterium]